MVSISWLLWEFNIMMMAMVFFAAKISNATNPVAKDGCEARCGNVIIPYPFGMKEGCYLSERFHVYCNTTHSPPKPFLGNMFEVTEVSLEQGNVATLHAVARQCYNTNGTLWSQNSARASLGGSNFTYSSTNKFIAVGCDTLAVIQGSYLGMFYRTGCVSSCENKRQLETSYGSCAGVGCCQISIPRGIWNVQIVLGSINNYTIVSNDIEDRCSYGFIIEEKAFNFNPDFSARLKQETMLPSIVDWFIRKQTCKDAKKNSTSYACKSINSECNEFYTGSDLPSEHSHILGYRCSCNAGFDGNPYLDDGCKDVNECEDPRSHKCDENSQCQNEVGNYTCICNDGFHGDGKDGCAADQVVLDKLLAGGAIGVAVLLVICAWLYYILYKRRKLMIQKMRFFEENGGLILREKLIRQGKSTKVVRIFTSEELKQATNNYDDARIIGQGGFGIVYKGYFPDKSVVAIKKSKTVDKTQIEQFINEVIVLSQINHRNAVKLLGCCLETQAPSLVYEYIDNGTLHDHLHDDYKILSLETRLRIALETAEVLSYLHSAASPPIIHRDVKPTNILLDNTFTTKVSDFGASRLVPLDQTGVSTLVLGTFGYLDPEYMQTSQLTEKSDVYSFGVVLAQLLTGKKAISFDRTEEERSLANHFLLSIKENRLLDVLDCHIILSYRNVVEHQIIRGVAMLAKRCLNVKGEYRPTMKEVATELQRFQVISPSISLKRGSSNLSVNFSRKGSIGSTENLSLRDLYLTGSRFGSRH